MQVQDSVGARAVGLGRVDLYGRPQWLGALTLILGVSKMNADTGDHKGLLTPRHPPLPLRTLDKLFVGFISTNFLDRPERTQLILSWAFRYAID
jgi:hypothetical protein